MDRHWNDTPGLGRRTSTQDNHGSQSSQSGDASAPQRSMSLQAEHAIQEERSGAESEPRRSFSLPDDNDTPVTQGAHSAHGADTQRRANTPDDPVTQGAYSAHGADTQRRASTPDGPVNQGAHSARGADTQRRASTPGGPVNQGAYSAHGADTQRRASTPGGPVNQGAHSARGADTQRRASTPGDPVNQGAHSAHGANTQRRASTPGGLVNQGARSSRVADTQRRANTPDDAGNQGASFADGDDPQRPIDNLGYDYYELYAFDVDCVPRGRLVDRWHFGEVLRNHGLRTHAAICYYTRKGKALHHNCLAVRKDGGECLLKPDMSTVAPAHRADAGGRRVAQIICDPTVIAHNNQPNEEDWLSPRTIAKRQVEKLAEEGFTIHYYFEMRFVLSKPPDASPVDNESSWGDIRKLMNYEGMMMEFMDVMREMGVFCTTVHLTARPSQLEIGLAFDDDLKGADMAARFRKEAIFFFENKGFLASFLLPTHMNHYLQADNGENVFNDGPLGISNIALQWLAGICYHLPALMALYRPTENCYVPKYCCLEERTQSPSVYGKHDRGSYFRRKQDGMATYLENRLPCSTSNPYLVLACTIAAGLSGIRNNLVFDLKRTPVMPTSLPKALENLAGDENLKKRLGEDFVECFIAKTKEDLPERTCKPSYKKVFLKCLGFGSLFLFCCALVVFYFENVRLIISDIV